MRSAPGTGCNEPGTLRQQRGPSSSYRLAAAGYRTIEVVSFVDPARVPQMAGAEEVLAALSPAPEATYAGLVLNRAGV